MGLERDLLALAATLGGPWRVTEEDDGKFFLRSSHFDGLDAGEVQR